MPLDSLRTDITNLTAFDWGTELENIVETNVDALTQLQSEQMAKGIDSEGNETALDGNGYQQSTIEYKDKFGQGLGAVTDRVTGYMTGNLYASLKADVKDGQYALSSTVDYFPALLARTGDKWMGLNEDRRKQFSNNVTIPAIQLIFKDKTGFEISNG